MGKQSEHEIGVDGRKRGYLLYVPDGYDAGQPAPLVLSLHGLADWPARQAVMSRWNELADREGCLVVYPRGHGVPLHWVTRSSWIFSMEPSQEAGFIDSLLDELGERFNIDTGRVYVNGFSNGGGMSFLLACMLPERFAAMGLVSAALSYWPEDCDLSSPLPAMLFHGTSDPIVPYHGGSTLLFPLPFPDIPAWAQRLAGCYGSQDQPETLPVGENVSGVRYHGAQAQDEVVLYTIQGGGHTWPGGNPLSGGVLGHTTQQIDATAQLWDFFCKYRKSD